MPYCKVCYGKNFGPKGYGFAGGSAGLSANRDDDNDDRVVMRCVSPLLPKCSILSLPIHVAANRLVTSCLFCML